MALEYKGVRLFNIIMAFGLFAGKPLKITDAAARMTDTELATLEFGLRVIARALRGEDAMQWPELHQLAVDIESKVGKGAEVGVELTRSRTPRFSVSAIAGKRVEVIDGMEFVARDEVAIEGKVRLLATADEFFGGKASSDYVSPILTDPTWDQVFEQFGKSIELTNDQHHIFLEGVCKMSVNVDDHSTAYRFVTGS